MSLHVCDHCGLAFERRRGDSRNCSKECKFWSKVDRSGECWGWTAAIHRKGYGQFYSDGQMKQAHRVAYELAVGPIPEGLQLDHLCRNRSCVNPEHLEPVTPRENWLRGESPSVVTYRTGICQRGHSMENAVTTATGYRTCRTCFHENAKRRYWEKKEAAR